MTIVSAYFCHLFGVRCLSSNMETELLEVIEVPASERVVCQHEGCGRPVYKRIHIIRHNDVVTFVGSGCFRVHYLHLCNESRVKERSHSGIPLSPEEVKLLLSNTELLLKSIQDHYLQPSNEAESGDIFAIPEGVSEQEVWEACLNRAKHQFRTERGLNPELPGWIGWVKSDAKKLFCEIMDRRRNGR